MSAVTREHAVLQIAEIAGKGLVFMTVRLVNAGVQFVVAGIVDDFRVVPLLGDGSAGFVQPLSEFGTMSTTMTTSTTLTMSATLTKVGCKGPKFRPGNLGIQESWSQT